MSPRNRDTDARVQAFLQMLSTERNAAAHTVRAYAKDLEKFSAFLGAEIVLNEVDHKLIRSFLAELHNAGLSKATIARTLAAVKSFFKWLGKEGVIARNPAALVSAPKRPKRLPRVPSIEQLNQVFQSKGIEQAGFAERDTLILELLYGSGLRNSELCGLRMTDLSLQKQLLLVRGKGKKERMVPFSDAAADALRSYLPKRSLLVAKGGKVAHEMLLVNQRGTHLTSRSVGRIVKRLAVTAGLSSDVHPHTMRHAFGTHMLAEGADLRSIQELLGHERLSTTQIYTQLTNEQVNKVYDETHPRAK